MSLVWSFPHPAPLSLLLSNRPGQGEEMTIFVGWNKDRELTHQPPSQKSRHPLGQFIYCRFQESWAVRYKEPLSSGTPFPSPRVFPFTPSSSILHRVTSHGGRRMEDQSMAAPPHHCQCGSQLCSLFSSSVCGALCPLSPPSPWPRGAVPDPPSSAEPCGSSWAWPLCSAHPHGHRDPGWGPRPAHPGHKPRQGQHKAAPATPSGALETLSCLCHSSRNKCHIT